MIYEKPVCMLNCARAAILLRTEMSILRVDKTRPLFQKATVTKLKVTQSTTRYQMKASDIIFPIIPHDSLWVKAMRIYVLDGGGPKDSENKYP